jgi:hypothetical protein
MAKELKSTVITDLSIHSDFIPALQSIMLYYIDQVYPKAEDLAQTLSKFQKMLDGSLEEKKVNLEWYEYHTFIFYSLIQILGAKANEQGLYQDSNVVLNEDILGKLTKAILDNDKKGQAKLYEKFFNDIQEQQNKSS